MYTCTCMYTLYVWKCMYEYVYVVVCFNLVKSYNYLIVFVANTTFCINLNYSP